MGFPPSFPTRKLLLFSNEGVPLVLDKQVGHCTLLGGYYQNKILLSH